MNLNSDEIRDLFISERIRRGYTQRDLARKGLSKSTISNYESGKNVSKETMIRLFKSLKIQIDDIPKLLRKRDYDNKLERLKLRFKSIESEMDCATAQNAFKQLKELEVEVGKDHPVIEYFKGKYHFKRNKFDKCITHYKQTIRLIDKLEDEYSYKEFCHFKIRALNDLGVISFLKNQLTEALHYVEKGLELIDNQSITLSEDNYCYGYYLLISKAIYLERLDRIKEAEVTLDSMWSSLSEIGTEIQLNMFDLHATIHKKQGYYEQAIHLATQGIELARREKNYDRCFELWTTLGSCYKHSGKLVLAKKCFQTASTFNDKIKQKALIASNDFELGLLYLQENQIHQAQNKLELALKGLEKSDAKKRCETLFKLGECYFIQLKNDQAVKMWVESLELAQCHSFIKQMNIISLKLAQYYEDKNSVKHQKYLQIFYKASIHLLGGENNMVLVENNKFSYDADPPHT